EHRSIQVTAKSEIKVAPDEVILNLAVRTRDKHLSIAKRNNDEITSAILPLATKYSIAAQDVQVTDLDISPDYGDYGNRSETPIAFEFVRAFKIRMTEFKNIEPYLSDAINAGLTDVSSLRFRVSNQREHQFNARKLAMTYAREKAEHLTELTKMKLGGPLRIEEDVEHNWNASGFGGAMVLHRNRLPKAIEKIGPHKQGQMFVTLQKGNDNKDKVAKVLVTPGLITISAEVMVEFEMSPE
ncbi:MAG: SIMPL domain-containing protein, partial [Planctomycetes bacterium]|nr:SIMPL domain-containing protein [Planctomycetota bacterium]